MLLKGFPVGALVCEPLSQKIQGMDAVGKVTAIITIT
jgi:hypothetical protein